MASLGNTGNIDVVDEAANESSSLLASGEQTQLKKEEQQTTFPEYESIAPKLKKSNNFIMKSVVYTVATAMVISMLCFAVVYTSKLPDDKPIEMIEAEGEEAPHVTKASVVGAKPMYNNNIFDPHEQGDDDYTSEYHPFYHQFVGKTLYMDGKYKDSHPRQGYNYHVEFFKEAGFTYWDTINYFPRINFWKIGEFADLDEDTHEVTGNHHQANVINLVGGTKCDKPMNDNKTLSEGKIHLIWGEMTKLVNVVETAPCEFMITVTSPDDQTFYPTSAPSSTPTSFPTMNVANLPVTNRTRAEKYMKAHKKKYLRRADYMALMGIEDGEDCTEGYFVNNEWHCKKNDSGASKKGAASNDQLKSRTNLEGIQDGKDCVEGYFVGNQWHCKDDKGSDKDEKSSSSKKK